ncbi:hypothetical protein H6P81_017767 [Aristolochia fimbriata]|uniref:Uncharacterized protein n=1 Tax=Aristolochia fimbriata TaxID=158543 RepID=A0AAV7DZU8_ARIFI|nr:hypothetical protein H6P81_017767 [Aristolochia fimbriata]
MRLLNDKYFQFTLIPIPSKVQCRGGSETRAGERIRGSSVFVSLSRADAGVGVRVLEPGRRRASSHRRAWEGEKERRERERWGDKRERGEERVGTRERKERGERGERGGQREGRECKAEIGHIYHEGEINDALGLYESKSNDPTSSAHQAVSKVSMDTK